MTQLMMSLLRVMHGYTYDVGLSNQTVQLAIQRQNPFCMQNEALPLNDGTTRFELNYGLFS